jgi:hypothetical protein
MLENLPTPGRLLPIVGLSAAMLMCVTEPARGQGAGTLAYVVHGYEECQGCAQDESSPRYPLGLAGDPSERLVGEWHGGVVRNGHERPVFRVAIGNRQVQPERELFGDVSVRHCELQTRPQPRCRR